ncbi:GH16284 [Drosophila grimshawi]|uniref:GH16284 n=1 Tax=Drosophila grimshawi TaxID=7222 RepID=B4IY58_DROGR|nr:GH16284 [Drosophila grimshawi]
MGVPLSGAISLTLVMVASKPLSSSQQTSKEKQQELYKQWPGVEDERFADAEVDNAYELYKEKTRKPNILQNSHKDKP